MNYQQDNTLFSEIVRQRQDNYHNKVEQGLRDYLLTVHNVNIVNLRKQVQNCNNFKPKEPFNKFRAFSYRQGDNQYTDYYFGDERILTSYSDGYIYYGAWKTIQQVFCC